MRPPTGKATQMRGVNSKHPPGTVGLAAAMLPRFWEFILSMEYVEAPHGSILSLCRGCDIAANFNRGVTTMKGDWIWFMGDDHTFPPDTLLRLLDHEVDVVVPIAPVKVAPYMPCVMRGPYKPTMDLYEWSELSEPGLYALPEGDFIGQAGMLVRKPVLDRIGYPWFRGGQFDAGRLQEDLDFCKRLQEFGYTVWIDRDIVLGHTFHNTIKARRDANGVYQPRLISGGVEVELAGMTRVVQADITVGDPVRPPLRWMKGEDVGRMSA